MPIYTVTVSRLLRQAGTVTVTAADAADARRVVERNLDGIVQDSITFKAGWRLMEVPPSMEVVRVVEEQP